ncbi:MAG: polyhydroxyalkanoate synthesis repressor PhaR, partial [Alphaproteobacteria bacterium]|nr:polyhydroxyalkanoate synthesis repressor PhaR [Alphaproteobacteria bacterium]
KYANRRLYNTATSSYVTLDHLCQMVKDGQDFVVRDAKTGEDITRSVLTQIIFEEESKGHNLLPVSFLRQLIGLYGDSLQAMVPGYLESTMAAFARNQEQIRQHMSETLGGANPFRQMEELGRQNMAMFQQALGMFTPFADQSGGGGSGNGREAPTNDTPEADDSGGELDRLRQQLAKMQEQLDALAGKS